MIYRFNISVNQLNDLITPTQSHLSFESHVQTGDILCVHLYYHANHVGYFLSGSILNYNYHALT